MRPADVVQYSSSLSSIAVVIPAWKPDEQLVRLVHSLSTLDFAAILIVNDGSSHEYDRVFEQVAAMRSVIVLHHEQNRGQGRALKTGLQYALQHLPGLAGAVTADADGQHAVNDIVRVAQVLAESGHLVLGVRAFAAGVPLRSRFGNILTQHVFAALSGYMISDTQSGLRAIPARLIPEVLEVRGDRYEFAISQLSYFCSHGRPPLQVPIATIYLNENSSSHFRPLQDSIKIYLLMFGYYTSLLVPVFVDLLLFVFTYMLSSLAWAVAMGRIGAFAAMVLQRRAGIGPTTPSLAQRLLSFGLSGICVFAGVWALTRWAGWNFVAAKIFVEAALWLALVALKTPLSHGFTAKESYTDRVQSNA